MENRSSKQNTKNKRSSNRSIPNRSIPNERISNERMRNERVQSERIEDWTTLGTASRQSRPARSTDMVRKTAAKRKKKKIDFVPIFFFLMFIYLGVHIVYFATKEKYPLYRVPRAEAIDENIPYRGILLKEEVAFYAQQKGYINYYISSGRRAAAGATIYTLDKDGDFSEMILSSSSSEQTLSKSDLGKIIQRIKNLQKDFDGMDFQKVYDTKSAISAVVMDALTAAAIEKLNESMGISGFTRITTDRSGVVSFTSDSYDGLQENQLTLECLKGTEYSKVVSTAGEEKQEGEFVYKLMTNEAFQIYFEMDEDTMMECGLDRQTKNTVSTLIYLNKIGQEVKVNMTIVNLSDGSEVVKLSIPKYGSNYADDRYIEFEIVKDNVDGIKIPFTSVVKKEYYMIPTDFVPTGEEYSGDGVLKKTATGEVIFVQFDSYKVDRDAGWYYVWSDELSIGDELLKVESEDVYTIITTDFVTGVYEANQGYTEFKIVTILETTEDNQYHLIKPKGSYGIAPFDYIVIEASKVTEGQVLE